jgi:hypothetical protein
MLKILPLWTVSNSYIDGKTKWVGIPKLLSHYFCLLYALNFYTKSDSILSKSMCTVPSSPTSNLASFSFQIAKLCVQCATLLSNMLYRVNGWAIPHGK